MTRDLQHLLQEQTQVGAFLSYVGEPRGGRPEELRPDCNGFVTALVLRALGSGAAERLEPEAEGTLPRALCKALDYLETCRDPDLDGAYRFWPRGQAPNWADELPPDADDTAVIASELFRWGRLRREDLRSTVMNALMPSRQWGLVALRGKLRKGAVPPWILPGATPTWLGEGREPVIDAVANANVCALYALAGATGLAGYRDACAQVASAAAWAGHEPSRLRAIAPYYGDGGELRRAVVHAIEAGATDLGPLVPSLPVAPFQERGRGETTLCCSFGAGALWISPAVTTARRLGRQHFQVRCDRVLPQIQPRRRNSWLVPQSLCIT